MNRKRKAKMTQTKWPYPAKIIPCAILPVKSLSRQLTIRTQHRCGP